MKEKFALVGISLITFTAFLDFTVVNIALPTIQKSLSLPITQLQWVSSLYFLGCSIFMVTMGKLGDIFGVRKILFLGAILFAIASLICGTALNGLWLCAGRFCQGVTAAILYTLSATLIALVFSEEKARVHAMSVNGIINGLGISFGPSLGGFILSFVDWRWIFLINIPIILAGLLIANHYVPKIKSNVKKVKIDYLGMALLAASIGGIMLGLTNGAEISWFDPLTLIYFAVAIIAFILLIPWELHRAEPLLNFHYFTRPYFIASILVCLVGGLIVGIVLFFDPLFLQVVRNDSAIKSGFVLLAIPIMTVLVPPLVRKWVNQFGKIVVIMLCVLCAVIGAGLHATFMLDSTLWYILLAFILIGASWATVNMISGLTAQAAVEPEEYGSATGTTYSFFNIAAAVGIAIAVVIFHVIEKHSLNVLLSAQHLQLSLEQQHLIRTLLSQPEKLSGLLSSFSGNIGAQLIENFKIAFVAGFHAAMWFLCIVNILIFLILFFVKKKIDRTVTHP